MLLLRDMWKPKWYEKLSEIFDNNGFLGKYKQVSDMAILKCNKVK